MMPMNMTEDQLKPALEIGVSVSEHEYKYGSLTESRLSPEAKKRRIVLVEQSRVKRCSPQGRICPMTISWGVVELRIGGARLGN